MMKPYQRSKQSRELHQTLNQTQLSMKQEREKAGEGDNSGEKSITSVEMETSAKGLAQKKINTLSNKTTLMS